MKCTQKYRVLGIIITAFIFFNVFLMSDSGYVDENNLIYSDATNGNIGIGTDSPVEKTHIAGDLYVSGSGGTIAGSNLENGWLRLGSTMAMDNNELYFGTQAYIGTITEDPLCINTNHATRIFVDSGGNIGIGTVAPSSKLEVNGNTNDVAVTIKTSGEKAYLHLVVDDTSWSAINGIDDDEFRIVNYDGSNWHRPFRIENSTPTNTLYLTSNGRVGIGTVNPDEKLTVDGNIHAEKVIVSGVSADFVFENDYNLLPLNEVESFISENGHLPEIPSAKEVETHGIELAEMNAKLLQKIEELTLYMIEQNKCMVEQEKRIAELEKKLSGNE